jgi:hypothetical protein
MAVYRLGYIFPLTWKQSYRNINLKRGVGSVINDFHTDSYVINIAVHLNMSERA